MTLAPQSASSRTQVGPDRTRVRSSTVKRARAFEAWGKGIAGASNAVFLPATVFPSNTPEGRNFADLIAIVYRLEVDQRVVALPAIG